MKLIESTNYRTKKADVMETSMEGLQLIIEPNENNPRYIAIADPRMPIPAILQSRPSEEDFEEYQRVYQEIREKGYILEDFNDPYLLVARTRIERLPPPHENFYYSCATQAKKGYGPLLYDKVIEIVSRLGCKLVNHAGMAYLETNSTDGKFFTSPQATRVWDKYKERSDVTKHDLGNDYHALSKDPNQKYFYEQ